MTTPTTSMPRPMRQLPRVGPGYPVPWFVAWIDGKPDFRIVDEGKLEAAVVDGLCWVCGQRRRGRTDSFLIGPMCAVNRTSAEPPSHYDCAVYSAKMCPFMANPNKVRRETNKPDGTAEPAGMMIKRNPGVGLVWTSSTWRPFTVSDGGVLFNIGVPVATEWYAHGREATREERLKPRSTQGVRSCVLSPKRTGRKLSRTLTACLLRQDNCYRLFDTPTYLA